MDKPKIDWREIDSVFLDMDGTLLDLHFDDHFWQEFLPQRYAELNRIEVSDAKLQLAPKFKEHEGTLNWYCLDFWSKQLNLDVAALKREITYLIDIHDGVVDFLTALHRLDKRVALVTNAHRKALELKMQRTQLDVHFDNIVISHDLGLAKENPGFWQRVQTVESFVPNRTLFVDDSISVLRNAAAYGIGKVLAVAKPSSKKPARDINEFPVLDSFFDIVPE